MSYTESIFTRESDVLIYNSRTPDEKKLLQFFWKINNETNRYTESDWCEKRFTKPFV